MARNEVVVDGITLTRKQVEEAYQKINTSSEERLKYGDVLVQGDTVWVLLDPETIPRKQEGKVPGICINPNGMRFADWIISDTDMFHTDGNVKNHGSWLKRKKGKIVFVEDPSAE